MRAIGIDLAPDEDNPSGVAGLEDNKIKTLTTRKDSEILDFVKKFQPKVVVFCMPLTVSENGLRPAEKEMQQMGYEIQPFSKAAKRAIHLKYEMENNTESIETQISAAKKAFGISDIKELQNVKILNIIKNEHEKNAILCAAVGLFYLEGNYTEFGDDESGKIIIPKLN